MDTLPRPAPEWQVSHWFNSESPPTLTALRGRVVVLHSFQMLCPGCVPHSFVQAAAVRDSFPASEVALIGLHTVFEHHAVMTPVALQVFLHEYRVEHPIGVDRADPRSPIPLTMQAYGWHGTPSLTLIDRQGRMRLQHFGRLPDLTLGAAIARLVAEPG